MPLYRYTAVDAAGQPVTGTMEEASARRVTEVLEEKGLQVSAVEPAGTVGAYPSLRAKLTWEDIEFLNAQLMALARGGLPLAPALAAIGKELRRGPLKSVIEDVRGALESGATLSDALERHRGPVPPVYIAAVRAGEQTGNLPAILELCAGYTAQMVALKSRLRESMTYPAVVLVTIAGVLFLLINHVVPEYAAMFENLHAALPWLTLVIIGTSEYVRANYGWIAAGICAVAIALIFAGRSPQGRYVADWFRLNLWGAGHAFNAASMARFCRSLGILLSGKVPADTSIELASATCGNAVLEAAALDAVDAVRSGSRLAQAFETTGYFTGLLCWLVQVSEDRGDTDRAFLDLAKTYEESFARYSRVMMSVLTPAILFVLAGIVLAVVLAMYMPMFTLFRSLTGQ